MTLHPLFLRKLKILGIICIFTIIVGTIFQKINNGYITFAGPLVGLFLGLGFGLLELFFLRRLNQRLKQLAFHHLAIIQVLLYTISGQLYPEPFGKCETQRQRSRDTYI